MVRFAVVLLLYLAAVVAGARDEDHKEQKAVKRQSKRQGRQGVRYAADAAEYLNGFTQGSAEADTTDSEAAIAPKPESLVGFVAWPPRSSNRQQLGHPPSATAYIPPESLPAWLAQRMQVPWGQPAYLVVENHGQVTPGEFPTDADISPNRGRADPPPFPPRGQQTADHPWAPRADPTVEWIPAMVSDLTGYNNIFGYDGHHGYDRYSSFDPVGYDEAIYDEDVDDRYTWTLDGYDLLEENAVANDESDLYDDSEIIGYSATGGHGRTRRQNRRPSFTSY